MTYKFRFMSSLLTYNFRTSLEVVNEESRSTAVCNKPLDPDSDIPDLPPRPVGTKLESVPELHSDILHSSRIDIDNGKCLFLLSRYKIYSLSSQLKDSMQNILLFLLNRMRRRT